jgi:hypothetical protein
MWSADCRYVAKLLPPASALYQERRELAVREFLLRRITGQMKSQLLRDRLDYFGLDRYNSEHWIGSHPHVQPCDMDPTETLNDVFRRDASIDTVTDHFVLSRAPRHTGFAVGNVWSAHERLQNSPSERLQEYFLLAGHVLKWGILYKEFPKHDSWVWRWFPDGDTWKNAVNVYGTKAVDVITQKFSIYRDDIRRSAFTPEARLRKQKFSSSWHTMPGASTPVVFYHIDWIKGIENSFDDIKLQVDIMNNSFSDESFPVPVYFNVVGNSDVNATIRVQRYCSKFRMLNCLSMFRFDKIVDGETLKQLHRFCLIANHSNHRVVYLSNKSIFPLHQGHNPKNHLLRQLTVAATSKLCLNPTLKSCNVCGLILLTVGVISFAGNMFTTSCRYVNKLHDPAEFEAEMRDTFGRSLLARLRQQITSNLFPDPIILLGLYQYSHEHWIASHPSVRLCDLSASYQGLNYWMKQDRAFINFSWSMAPRHSDSIFPLNSKKSYHILSNQSMRQREYSLLAGNMMRWQNIYGEVPPHDSWVWSWFPDGTIWRNEVATFDSIGFDTV